MRKILFVTGLLAASCAEQVGPGIAPDEDEDSIYVPDPTDEGEAPAAAAAFRRDSDSGLDICALLPPDDGACTHACDPVALSGFIPEGTCVTFTCRLLDGSTYRTGGCNN